MKWDDMILRVEWKWQIKKYLDNSLLDESRKNFILDMTSDYPEKFDGLMLSKIENITVNE